MRDARHAGPYPAATAASTSTTPRPRWPKDRSASSRTGTIDELGGGERDRQADREPDRRHDEDLAQHHPDQLPPLAPSAIRSPISLVRRATL